MKRNLKIAIRMTLATTVLLGVVYPLVVTGIAQLLFPDRANGQLIHRSGKLVGARLIGQPFSSPGYFWPRPSAAGLAGYDATASGGSNLGPTNRVLLERVKSDWQKLRTNNPDAAVPVDLVTASGSGLDPHISPAAAEFQTARVARERNMDQAQLRALVQRHTEGRQFGFFGERRVNVLALNLELDEVHPLR